MPSELVSSTVILPSKPDAPLHHSYVPPISASQHTSTVLLVFVNGLGLPQAGWYAAVTVLCDKLKAASKARPAILLYDRFGQGKTTSRDPLDAGKEPGYGHDLTDAAHDLQAMIQYFRTLASKETMSDAGQQVKIMLVGNSIGCPIARLHFEKYPGVVSGLIMLDSNTANNDQLNDMWPDPEAADFDPTTALPPNVSVEELIKARQASARLFGPNVINPESLDRRNAHLLLPHSDAPALKGHRGQNPLLYVVGHDPVEFAKQMQESPRFGINPALTDMYPNAVWRRYNEGLVKLSSRSRGPLIATGCGHFIQHDDPDFVANLIIDMLDELQEEGADL